MGYSWLTNAGIEGGSKIDLLSTNIILDWNNFVNSPPVPGINTTWPYGSRIHETDYTGHANPRIIVDGIMPSGTKLSEGSVTITPVVLGSFLMFGSPSWFYDDYLILNPLGSTQVMPVSAKITHDVKSKPEFMRYSLVLEETKEW